jgi:2-keto-4-pentenoate hydratase/2-oxohepta-3-ene-1,7-dioic acid hydratase in catechol pathway
MRLVSWQKNGTCGLAARRGSQLVNLEGLDLMSVLQAGQAGIDRARALSETGTVLDEAALTYLPPLTAPPKIVCVGINYWDHARENKLETPAHPTFFARFASTLIGHEQPIIRPIVSEQLDYEGELAVIIGKPGRHIGVERAPEHVAGYAVFNDASVRDYQMRGQQWTLGKNFDGTGPFGPDFVTADEVPPGGKGLRLTTRLNGATVQSSNTDQLIFDVPALISRLSEALTLETGDVIVTGTPGGIGFFRTPKLFMKHGDVCEIEIEGIGTLRNRIQDEAPA